MDRYDQQGQPHPQDQRPLAHAAVAQLAAAEYHVRLAFEVEWVVSDLTVTESPDQYVPATSGPGYGFAPLGATLITVFVPWMCAFFALFV